MSYSRDQVERLLDDPKAASRVEGSFLGFLFIGVIERFGQWRFAGAANTLQGAFERVDALIEQLTNGAADLRGLARGEVLEYYTSIAEYGESYVSIDDWGQHELFEDRELDDADIVILAQGGAPYDDVGFSVLSVPSLDGHPYATRKPESRPPAAWSGGDFEDDLDRPPDYWLPEE